MTHVPRRPDRFEGGQGTLVADDVLCVEFPDRTVLCNLSSGLYLSLDASGALLWHALKTHGDLGRAADAVVAARPDADRATVEADLRTLLARVHDRTASTPARRPHKRWSRVLRLPLRMVSRAPADQLALLYAAAVVVVVEIGLRVSSVRRVARLLGTPLADDAAPAPAGGNSSIRQLPPGQARRLRAGEAVLRHWLYDGTCLRRALMFGYFLRAHHPVLRIGVAHEGSTLAHAWIETPHLRFGAQPGYSTLTR